MKTRFTECNDVNRLSEFDPAPFIYSKCFCNFLKTKVNTKKVLDFPPTCFRTSADPPKLIKSEGGNSPRRIVEAY